MDLITGDSSAYDNYPLTPSTTAAPSVSSRMAPPRVAEWTDVTATEGLEGVRTLKFTSIKKLNQVLEEEASKASPSPYLILKSVKTTDLAKIERARENGQTQRSLRLAWFEDLDLLIVKVPTMQHEWVYGQLMKRLLIMAGTMGLEEEICYLGATKYQGRRNIAKEADCAFKPLSRRPRPLDWPTLVIEAGWSESRSRLRVDARIWLENSGGEVKIVLLISPSRAARSIIIEKWESTPLPDSRPRTRSTITIEPGSVTGAPLTLDFQKVFLRQPVPPQEHDFVFDQQYLANFAQTFWTANEIE
ncbi:hypothetical protein DV738_g2048, partial [Chaetothyriales sp. CBS 135597]